MSNFGFINREEQESFGKALLINVDLDADYRCVI